MKQFRLDTDDPAFELNNGELGVFVRALQFGSGMTVSGVFVNGHVCSREEMALECCSGDVDILDSLVSTGHLECVGGVYMVGGRARYYGDRQLSDSELAKLVGSLRGSVEQNFLPVVTARIVGNGEVKKDLSSEELKQEILRLYNLFGDDRNTVTSYIGSFRSKKQVTQGKRMDLSKHFRLLKEVHQMYESGVVTFGRRVETVGRDIVVDGLARVGLSNKLGLRNHNYLKVVCLGLFDQPGKTVQRRADDGAKRSTEGY